MVSEFSGFTYLLTCCVWKSRLEADPRELGSAGRRRLVFNAQPG